MQLSQFNSADAEEAGALVLACAAVPAWSRAVVAGRPYPRRTDLVTTAHAASLGWTRDDAVAALAEHPRIGERRATPDAQAGLSRAEQSAVGTDPETVARLRTGNAAYEERFGRVFLVRAAGRSQDDILSELSRRLGNDPDTEWDETIESLREIALLRLQNLIEADA